MASWRISIKQAGLVDQTFSIIFFLLSASISTKAWLVSSHHFFIFTFSEHDNTILVSCLLPKMSENIPGVLSLVKQTFYCIFQLSTGYFIYLSIRSTYISPSRTILNRVHKFLGTSTRLSRFHTCTYPLQNNGPVPQNLSQILKPIPGGPSQLSLATNQSVLQ